MQFLVLLKIPKTLEVEMFQSILQEYEVGGGGVAGRRQLPDAKLFFENQLNLGKNFGKQRTLCRTVP